MFYFIVRTFFKVAFSRAYFIDTIRNVAGEWAGELEIAHIHVICGIFCNSYQGEILDFVSIFSRKIKQILMEFKRWDGFKIRFFYLYVQLYLAVLNIENCLQKTQD